MRKIKNKKTKIKTKKKLTQAQKFNRKLAIEIDKALKKADQKYALLIREMTRKVERFKEPVNRIIECMEDKGHAFLFYKEKNYFFGHVMKKEHAISLSKKDPAIEFLATSSEIGDIFMRSNIKEEDIVRNYKLDGCVSQEINIDPSVPPDMALSFIEGHLLAEQEMNKSND